ncbi:hypothetical protein MUB24_18525 [Lederbergia sp. NSJ-179]|nr:hypothetical protein [Lederbergia sp. NSJ-179]MCJ7842836.1 hypothetical protein [Lederbergia sp. NSJ-179]
MENSDQKEPMIFDIHVTEGTHYEVGKQRAITLDLAVTFIQVEWGRLEA